MIRKWVRLSILYLFLVGVLGCLLRLIFFSPVEGVNFRYFLHAHSHIAFLGWVFNALFAGFIFVYIPEKAKNYLLLFWLLQFTVLGMLISFPLQGYAAVSITFSTLHIFLSYWFAARFRKDTSKLNNRAGPFSLSLIRWGLIFMIFSSIGPFALGVIMAKGLSGTDFYQLSVYFYLHFQYNGWFSFAIFGLFFSILEKNNIFFSSAYAKKFLWLMVVACFLGYSLSTLWTQPPVIFYVTGFAAACLQLLAWRYLHVIISNSKNQKIALNSSWTLKLMKIAYGAFIIKIILQFASAIPIVADLAYRIRNFTIGYLHIVLIGFVTVFLLAWFSQVKLLNLKQKISKMGIILFLIGFLFSEILIFLQPIMLMLGLGNLTFSYKLVFFVSLLMPAGTLLLLYENSLFKIRKEEGIIQITNSDLLKDSIPINSGNGKII
jgi:hypothetical protein